jgi:hypothetical protein
MKKIKIHQHPVKISTGLLTVTVAMLLFILWFYGSRLNTLWLQSGNTNLLSNNSAKYAPMNADIKFYIHTALSSLYNKRPATEVAQQRVYFPEAHIYVPLSSYARDVVYSWQDADHDTPATLTATNDFNVRILPNTFDDVPCLQRHVTVVVSGKTSYDGTFVEAVKLADGRTLNIYKQDHKNCKDIWSQGAPDKLVEILRQAKSY